MHYIKHPAHTHGIQLLANVRVGAGQGRQHAKIFPRQNRKLGQQTKGGTVDAVDFGQVNDYRPQMPAAQFLLDSIVENRAVGQTYITSTLEDKAAILDGIPDLAVTYVPLC